VAEETQRKVADGAAEIAPTAPHATPRTGPAKTRSGPERFWAPRWRRLTAAGALTASLVTHYAIGPWSLLPENRLEFHDVEGEISIPVDIIEDEPPPPEPPPPPPASTGEAEQAAAPVRRPAARPVDAGHDAAPDEDDAGTGEGAAPDAEAAGADASPNADGADGGRDAEPLMTDAGIALAGDAGVPGRDGPRDPSAIVGAAGGMQTGPPLVQLLVNMEVIRASPVGAKMGPLVSAIPQWDDFISGTRVDPLRDTDWVMIYGPSLINTERDAILVHYSTTDKLVDEACAIVAKKYDRGGAFDTGVPGTKAWLGHADRARRIFLRAQPHLLVVVPEDYAKIAARTLVGGRTPAHVRPGEAMRLTLKNPHRPMPFIPQTVSEMRLWIVPRPADGGADVFAEGDTPDAAAASAVAEELRKVVRQQNSIGVRIVTQGLLNNVEIAGDGAVVRLKLSASREQLEAVLGVVAAQLGVTLPAPVGSVRPR